MKLNHKLQKLNDITCETVDRETLVDLFTNPVHLLPDQRGHEKTARKKKYIHGVLKGDSRIFVAVYVLDERQIFGADGYNRGALLNSPDGKGGCLAAIDPKMPCKLIKHVVQTMEDASALYGQLNSLEAAKRAGCWFDGGLRQARIKSFINSDWVLGKGHASAVQYAAGKRGARATQAAVVALKDGIVYLNSLQLTRATHEFVGSMAAFYAIAQHCKDTGLVEDFIIGVNRAVYNPPGRNKAQEALKTYHDWLVGNSKRTGAAANEAAFEMGLSAFASYAYLSRRKSLRMHEERISLARFTELMKAV
jgi:hypothetical protein